MKKICRFVEEYALASMGLNEDQIQHAVSRVRFSEVEPLIMEVVPQAFQEKSLRRIHALRELSSMDYDRDPELFQETMTTANFATYFSDALSRAFYRDYQYKVGSWMNYTYADTTPDFRDVDRYRMTEPGTLYKRREKQEAAATYVSDSGISYGVDEYARQFDVSWQTILNDDLGKIQETPMRMANAAARWLDSWVSALYDNATTQAALVALGAVYSGTGRLTHANLAIGLNAMMRRTDVNGNQMNIQRVHLVIPSVSELQAATVLESALASGTPNNDKNVLPRFISGVHVDPYITFAGPNVPWYLVADPSEIPTIPVARLAGMPGPIVARKRSDLQIISGTAPAAFAMGDFATGNIEYEVVDVIGGWDDDTYVGVGDFRGIYYSSGTTP